MVELPLEQIHTQNPEQEEKNQTHHRQSQHLAYADDQRVYRDLQSLVPSYQSQRSKNTENSQDLDLLKLIAAIAGEAKGGEDDDDEVEYVADLAEVGIGAVEGEAVGEDFEECFKDEDGSDGGLDDEEYVLLVGGALGEGVVDGEEDAGEEDEEDDEGVEVGVGDEGGEESPEGVARGEEEEGVAAEDELALGELAADALVELGPLVLAPGELHQAVAPLELPEDLVVRVGVGLCFGVEVGLLAGRGVFLVLLGDDLVRVGGFFLGGLFLVRLAEVVEQHGHEELEDDEVADDHDRDEVDGRVHGLVAAHVVVRDLVPRLVRDQDEHCDQRVVELLEVRPRWVPVEDVLGGLPICVEPHLVREQLHAQQGRHHDEEQEQDQEVDDRLQGLHDGRDQLGELLPLLRQLEHPEQPQRPEGLERSQEPYNSVNRRLTLRVLLDGCVQDQLHQRDQHDHAVEHVQRVLEVSTQPVPHHLHPHLDREYRREHHVHRVQDRHLLLADRVPIHRQSYRVQYYK